MNHDIMLSFEHHYFVVTGSTPPERETRAVPRSVRRARSLSFRVSRFMALSGLSG